MFKIQKTTITDQKDNKARLELQVSDNKDLELSSQHVICCVVVSAEAKSPLHDPISLRLLQVRALKEAAALIDQADDALRQ